MFTPAQAARMVRLVLCLFSRSAASESLNRSLAVSENGAAAAVSRALPVGDIRRNAPARLRFRIKWYLKLKEMLESYFGSSWSKIKSLHLSAFRRSAKLTKIYLSHAV